MKEPVISTSPVVKVRDEELVQKTRGRPRDGEARKRILDSALQLLEETGFSQVTTDLIAERAGASKATIYRWWPNKAAVLIEAFREGVAPDLPFPTTGDLREDIRTQLRQFVKMLTGRRGRTFAAFLAAAQTDAEVATAFRELWTKPRRADAKDKLDGDRKRGDLCSGVDLDIALDMLYGPIYYRLLVGHSALTLSFADSLADLALDGLLRKADQ